MPPVFLKGECKALKRIISILLLTVTLLSAFSVAAFAGDDNATGGDGTTHSATEGYGWYNSSQYLYKVTLYVGKKDTASKQSSLANDFYRVGTVIVKKTGWNVSSSVMFGSGTKMDYYSGAQMERLQSPYIISDANCPRIPIVCKGGDIDTVKQYFGSTGTMTTLLNGIAAKEGNTAYGLLKNKTFTINGTTKSGWSEADLMPNGMTNKVPWVIIYEPIMILHLKDKKTMVAFTATEYAIAQENGWYDWKYSKGEGQNVAILPERHLPSSIQLEESWFGYPVYPTRNDSYKWSYEETVKGGGWGMRWLGPSITNGIDFSVDILEYDPSPLVGKSVKHKIRWYNNKSIEQTVLCEIYSGDYLVTSYNLTIPGNSYVTKNTSLIYNAAGIHRMIAKINYAYRDAETNPNNNTDTVVVIPRSSDDPEIDYGCYFNGVETPEPNGYGQVVVCWNNYSEDYGTVLCELYRDDVLIWSDSKSFDSYESIEETYSVYYPGTDERTLTAKINYEYKDDETDPTDNMRQKKVKPVPPLDSTYDFSVSGISVSPVSIYDGESATVSFVSDNWNKDLSYESVLVELLLDGEVVKSERVNFTPYGRNSHTYTIPFSGSGVRTVAARINWENRYSEDNRTNNYTVTTATVMKYYEFSVSDLEVTPLEVNKNETVNISFRTDNRDSRNSYENIPVQILYNDKVVYTSYENYEPGGYKLHNITLNVGDTVGSNELFVRINWAKHLEEININNNETDTAVITVLDPIDLWLEAVTPNSDYRAGVQVITSYIMHNDSGTDILPSDDNTVSFEAYYYNGSNKVSIKKLTWNNAVIPAYDTNLVYFKWKVPAGIAGSKVYAEATVNSGRTVSEITFENNDAKVIQTVAAKPFSAAPDTRYEREKPAGFSVPVTPSEYSDTMTWSMWIYENDAFKKVNYGVQIADVIKPSITPDPGSHSEKDTSGIWIMKSGYGFSLSFFPALSPVGSGYDNPPSGATTSVQSAYATFPEFGYLKEVNKYRTLELFGGAFQFGRNGAADNYERLHFTPLWYPDGAYKVTVTVYDFWTPAGMATARVISKGITISGSAYDDWSLGH